MMYFFKKKIFPGWPCFLCNVISPNFSHCKICGWLTIISIHCANVCEHNCFLSTGIYNDFLIVSWLMILILTEISYAVFDNNMLKYNCTLIDHDFLCCIFPDVCSQCCVFLSLVWTQLLCIPYCWISVRWTVTGGSTWTGTGWPGGRLSLPPTTLSTCIRTRQTSAPTGWRNRSPSQRSNSPTKCTGMDRSVHIVIVKKSCKNIFIMTRYYMRICFFLDYLLSAEFDWLCDGPRQAMSSIGKMGVILWTIAVHFYCGKMKIILPIACTRQT